MDFVGGLGQVIVHEMPAVVAAILLWLVLPRGAVLVRSPRTHYPDGTPLYDTWEVRNDSAVAVRIRSAAYMGSGTYDDARGRMNWDELPTNAHDSGLLLHLRLDDEVPEMRRLDAGLPWRKVVILPGDSMVAHVPNNHDVRIRYRRAGFWGLLERREIRVHGGV